MNPRRPWAVGLLLLVSALPAWAVDKTWTGAASSTWSAAGNWTPAGAPGANDRAIVTPAGNAPTVTASTTINQLLVQPGAVLTIANGITLTVDGGAAPIIDGTGTVASAGTGLLRVSDGANNAVLINASITLGHFTLDAATTARTYVVAPGTTVTINGNLTLASGRFRCGTAGQAAVTVDVNGNFSLVDAGAKLPVLEMASANSVFRLSGNWTQTGTFISGTTSTVLLDGIANQAVSVQRATLAQYAFANLTISNPTGIVTYANNGPAAAPNGFNVLGNLTVQANSRLVVADTAVVGDATADVFGIGSGATATFQTQCDIDGTLSFNVDGGADDGRLVLQGTLYPPADGTGLGTTVVPGAGTIRCEFTASATLPVAGRTLPTLEVDMPGAGPGLLGLRRLAVDGAFSAQTLRLTAGSLAIPAAVVTTGSVDSSPPGTSILDFTAPGTLVASGNVDLDHVSQGPGSVLRFNGAAPQTLQLRATTASDYHDLDGVDVATGASVTVLDNPNSDFRINGPLTIQSGAALTVLDGFDPEGALSFAAGGNNLLRIEGAVVADATPLGSSFAAGTGTVVYGGAATDHVVHTTTNGAGIAYHHLAIDTSGGRVATQQATGLLRINGTFSVLGAASVFTAGAGNLAVAGSFVCNGTFNALAHTVTMDGTGSITGTSPALSFNSLLVNGLTTSVVTAARSFSVGATFQVLQGSLTTAGVAPPVTVTALAGLTVGNGAGAAGTARLDLRGGSTLAIQSGTSFLVSAPDGLFAADSEPSGTPVLTRAGAGVFNAVVSGGIDVRRLAFSFGDLEGLELAPGATITSLRNVAFTNVNAAAGSRSLTVRSPGISLDIPGCTFDARTPGVTYNAWVQDTTPADATPLRVRLENRGVAPAAGGGGPGAGEAYDADDDADGNGVLNGAEVASANHGGGIIQWVYTANVAMTGQIQGFPMVAFDWNTFQYYSTYVLARDSLGTGQDRIYVLDSEGDLKAYSFTLPAGSGDVIGPLHWNTEGALRVVYFGTTTGLVYKLIDTGAALQPPASGPWTTPYSNGVLDQVTSPLISDGTNLYFGGVNGSALAGLYGIYRLAIATKTLAGAPISVINQEVRTAPSYAEGLTTRYLYVGTRVGNNTSHIYRVHVNNWVIDADFRRTSYLPDLGDMESDVVAYINVPTTTLYVGELSGRMHALPALGTPAQFTTPLTGFPFRDASSAAIRGGAYREFTVGRLFYGDDAGQLYTLKPVLPAAPVLNTDYFRLSTGSSGIRSMPLYQSGIVYAATSAGLLVAVDAASGAAPPQSIQVTWNIGSALGDVSRDIFQNRILVGAANGRVYAVPQTPDPTPAFP